MRKWTYSFIYYFVANVISFYQLNYCFSCLLKFSRIIENIKYCIKLHIPSSKHSSSCKISSLYSRKYFIWMICDRVCESAYVYLISMFCSCFTVNRLVKKNLIIMIIENLSYLSFEIYWYALLQTHQYINNFVNKSIKFLSQEVMKANHIILYGLYLVFYFKNNAVVVIMKFTYSITFWKNYAFQGIKKMRRRISYINFFFLKWFSYRNS